MNRNDTAIILIGFQNDFYSSKGSLYEFIEESENASTTLRNVIHLLDLLKDKALFFSIPILFSEDYAELIDPIGILAIIKEVEAFKINTIGAQIISTIEAFNNSLVTIPEKQSINAFINTSLDSMLRKSKIKNVVLAGCISSICIDSTGRSAFDKGYKVFILSDCISESSKFENNIYLNQIFPLYAKIIDSQELIQKLF